MVSQKITDFYTKPIKKYPPIRQVDTSSQNVQIVKKL